MKGKFEDKVVVVTGGTSGIGFATATAFAREGAFVFITGRRREALEAAARAIGDRVTPVHADMADLAAIDRLKTLSGRSTTGLKSSSPMPAEARSRRLVRSLRSTLTRPSTRM